MYKITIDEMGKINKMDVISIHEEIYDKLYTDNDSFGLKYGIYLMRNIKFLTLYSISKNDGILDMFCSNKTINVDLKQLINWENICKNYIKQIQIIQKQLVMCSECNKEIKENIDGEFCCNNCGFVFDTRLPGIKDMENINVCKTYYNLNSNLLNAIEKFEGKNVFITPNTWKKINNEISKRQLKINNIKCEHIIKILKDLKITKHYNDVYYIFCLLTNKEPIDIKKYIPQIIKYHNELENAYKVVKDKNRINSLNVQYKLIKILGLCGIDKDIISNFCSLKTEQKMEEHEEKWKEICDITGWEC